MISTKWHDFINQHQIKLVLVLENWWSATFNGKVVYNDTALGALRKLKRQEKLK